MTEKPKIKSADAERELEKVQEQFKALDNQVQTMTLDRMNQAPKADQEPQTKLSQVEIDKSKYLYLKPARSISSKELFNEKWRKHYNFQKEYVHFTAEHKEIIGEIIEIWTKPFPGMPAELWNVPTGKPIWGPRYLAEQITKCRYHRLVMKQNVLTEENSVGQMFGALAVDTTIQRLDALHVSTRKSIFMGAGSF